MSVNKTNIKICLSSFFLHAALCAAEEGPAKLIAKSSSSALPYQTTQVFTFKELGAKRPLSIVGIDARDSVAVSLREDQMVSNATLDLQYSYSAALIPELSSLKVLMNDELIGTIPVTKEGAGQVQEAKFNIPSWMFVNYNQLGVQLIGHYSKGCEDPNHSGLWARISQKSSVSITTQPLQLANDLALLPLPFYSHHDSRKLSLPFVFTTVPDAGQIEAAGFVASWFGQLADYRGADFSVKLNHIPEHGHAIVFLTPQHPLALDGVPEIVGPGLAIVNNPNDEYGKLLVIYGRNDHELKSAARALLLNRKAFSGPFVEISDLEMPPIRSPYDAPLWIQQDRPVKLGEMVGGNVLASIAGTQRVIRMPLRFPPDLFLNNTKGVPLLLKYKYTPRAHDDRSALNVSINDRFMTSEPLLSEHKLRTHKNSVLGSVSNEKQITTETKLYLPGQLLSSNSELTFHFLFDQVKPADCKEDHIDFIKDHGVIDADSSIDISHIKHFIRMPNLAAFANSGYPFTRMADLSETAVVLPDMPDNDTLEAYLQLMAKMGESTGYPAIRVTVLKRSELNKGLDKDVIVLEKAAGDDVWEQWKPYLPINAQSDKEGLAIANPFVRAWYWLFPDKKEKPESNMLYAQYSRNGFLAGFESPFKAGRSVVLWAANDTASFKQTMDIMLSPDKGLPSVQGSLVTVHDGKVRTVSDETTYTLGSLGGWESWRWYLSKNPFIGVLVALLAILMVSLIFTGLLNAKAKRRLAGEAS